MLRGWLASLAILASGCASLHSATPVDGGSAAAPVIAAERAFAARHQLVSVKRSFIEYAADDAVVIWGGEVENAKISLAGWPDVEDAGKIIWWPAFAGIAGSGDIGFTTGPSSFEGGKRYGYYLTVWKKQADGSWKWTIDLGTRQGVKPAGGPADPVILLPVSAAAGMEPGKAWRELLEIDRKLGQHTGRDSGAVAGWLAPEARLIGFEPATAVGLDAARASIGRRPQSIVMKPEGGGVSLAGDLGWTYGFADWSEAGAGRRGAYLRIWQRRPSGWLIVVEDIYPL